MTASYRLLGDIGATNTRFAMLSPDGGIAEPMAYETLDFDHCADAIRAYLTNFGASQQPVEAALAVAAPILEDEVAMLNAPWRFSISETQKQFGWKRLEVVNDFAANALAVPRLGAEHLAQIGDGAPVKDAAIAVLGPGTGLGVAGLVRDGARWIDIAGEGGHATLAAMDGREAAIIDILRRQYAHVSAERVLSGPGLVNLYDSLCELAGKPAGPLSPDHITNLYPGCDPQCREAVNLFCAILGTFAGNLALTLGARGGVYIMGGIVPRILDAFRQSAFRERFEFKGRYRRYLEAIPTYVVTHPTPAFLGLKSLLEG